MTVRIGYMSPEPGGTRVLHLFNWRKVTSTDTGAVAKTRFVGYHRYNREALSALRDQGVREDLKAIGLVSFTDDVTPALFDAVFERFKVRGWVRNRPTRLSARPLR